MTASKIHRERSTHMHVNVNNSNNPRGPTEKREKEQQKSEEETAVTHTAFFQGWNGKKPGERREEEGKKEDEAWLTTPIHLNQRDLLPTQKLCSHEKERRRRSCGSCCLAFSSIDFDAENTNKHTGKASKQGRKKTLKERKRHHSFFVSFFLLLQREKKQLTESQEGRKKGEKICNFKEKHSKGRKRKRSKFVNQFQKYDILCCCKEGEGKAIDTFFSSPCSRQEKRRGRSR